MNQKKGRTMYSLKYTLKVEKNAVNSGVDVSHAQYIMDSMMYNPHGRAITKNLNERVAKDFGKGYYYTILDIERV